MIAMILYDITLPLSAAIAEWPGDTPYSLTRNLALTKGDSVNLSSIGMSVHNGTHTDAPYHFSDTGNTAETLDLSAYIGPAIVVDVSGKPLISLEDLASIDLSSAPRVLFKTSAWQDHSHFPDHIPVLAPEVPAYLHAQGAVLAGFDVPSVDALDSKTLPNHHALGKYGIAILESLLLADVPPGIYELLALPLKLVGADGAPVRAVLRSV